MKRQHAEMVDKRSAASPSRREMHRKLVVLVQVWGDSFFHFVNEGLHRLMQVYDLLLADPEIEVLTFTGPPFIRQFFELLGIDSHRLVQHRRGFEYYADVLIVPAAIPCGRAAPKLTHVLRTRVSEIMLQHQQQQHLAKAKEPSVLGSMPTTTYAAATMSADKPHILMVNRIKGAQRHIVNFESLVAELQRRFPDETFVPFLGEELSVRQSISLFQGAKIIVAPHGA